MTSEAIEVSAMDSQLVFFICVAGTVTAVGFFLSRLFVGGKDHKLRARLADNKTGESTIQESSHGRSDTVMMPTLMGS